MKRIILLSSLLVVFFACEKAGTDPVPQEPKSSDNYTAPGYEKTFFKINGGSQVVFPEGGPFVIPVGKEGLMAPAYSEDGVKMTPLFQTTGSIVVTSKYTPDEKVVKCVEKVDPSTKILYFSMNAVGEGDTMVQVEVYTKGDNPELVVRRTFKIQTVDYQGYVDLSEKGSANCYIVSKSGKFYFNAMVKGSSSESIAGNAFGAKVLWETFGNDTAPSKGDIVSSVSYNNGQVFFSTPSTLKNGNAVIAIYDAEGTILWSWHIWVCNGYDPVANAQVYNNGAGTFMDRNLGATSVTKTDISSVGLLYQWGRKDPFPGTSTHAMSLAPFASASLSPWPDPISSDVSVGTIAYATQHPSVFILANTNNNDWLYSTATIPDNTRWTTSDKDKSIYDPCPYGWRIPDGGPNKNWAKALGSNSLISGEVHDKDGFDFTLTKAKLGSGSTPIWYPYNGYIDGKKFKIYNADFNVYVYSASPISGQGSVYVFSTNSNGNVYPTVGNQVRANAAAVRCVKATK